ncbi:MAG: chemotaxis protein MotB, partial [Moorella sp. (in: Bacteria)]|nr:chemotaxis protein MotB [Moorella sp. (in: firmicutes)]
MARRQAEKDSHDNKERWLLTYADLITLLMIFFVVMYSISNINAQKMAAL